MAMFQLCSPMQTRIVGVFFFPGTKPLRGPIGLSRLVRQICCKEVPGAELNVGGLI